MVEELAILVKLVESLPFLHQLSPLEARLILLREKKPPMSNPLRLPSKRLRQSLNNSERQQRILRKLALTESNYTVLTDI
jgi:hypothetical protein